MMCWERGLYVLFCLWGYRVVVTDKHTSSEPDRARLEVSSVGVGRRGSAAAWQSDRFMATFRRHKD